MNISAYFKATCFDKLHRFSFIQIVLRNVFVCKENVAILKKPHTATNR